jgi:hypothetical protein
VAWWQFHCGDTSVNQKIPKYRGAMFKLIVFASGTSGHQIPSKSPQADLPAKLWQFTQAVIRLTG